MRALMLDVRRVRELAGLTQVQLAEHADVRQATISAIENGRTTGIDFDVLERLAKALNVDPGSLIVRVPPGA
jgi:transcriptional regulator with XRE-family HTH domain